MASKLIYKVDPIWPQGAKDARLSGIVILDVTVGEQGYVTDLKIARGHPMLDKAAIDAVRQWRYAPTYLNGEAVPVVTNVIVGFNVPNPVVRVRVDDGGNLVEPTGAPISFDSLAGSKAMVYVDAGQEVPFAVLDQTMRKLQDIGIENPMFSSPGYIFRAGRLFYAAPGPGVRMVRTESDLQAPELALDMDALVSSAKASDKIGDAPGVGYVVCVDEGGEIVAVQKSVGPDIPEVETALRLTRVLTPGRLAGNAVPVAVIIYIQVR